MDPRETNWRPEFSRLPHDPPVSVIRVTQKPGFGTANTMLCCGQIFPVAEPQLCCLHRVEALASIRAGGL